jgi:hypothetical protein
LPAQIFELPLLKFKYKIACYLASHKLAKDLQNKKPVLLFNDRSWVISKYGPLAIKGKRVLTAYVVDPVNGSTVPLQIIQVKCSPNKFDFRRGPIMSSSILMRIACGST